MHLFFAAFDAPLVLLSTGLFLASMASVLAVVVFFSVVAFFVALVAVVALAIFSPT